MTEITHTRHVKISGHPLSEEPGLNGLTDNISAFHPGWEINTYKTKSPNQYQSIILVPGFGHTVNNIGESFTNMAKELANKTGAETLLTVNDQRDESNMLAWSWLSVGVSMAIESATNLTKKPVHIIAFSRHTEPAIKAVFNLLQDQEGFLKYKYYEKWKKYVKKECPVISLTLCAPAFWQNLPDIFMQGNSLIETADHKGPLLTVGSRRSKVFHQNLDYKN
jgi:hypothetical protein